MSDDPDLADVDLSALGVPAPGPGADPDEPAVALQWLARMARATRAASPSTVDPALEAELAEELAARPAPDRAFGQLHIDAASCLRRAAIVKDAAQRAAKDRTPRVIAIGDDDGVTLALRLLGLEDVHAVDLDEAILRFLAGRGVPTTRADVLGSSVPEPLRRAFDVAVTDPFRDLDGGLGFLSYAAACVREAGALAWVDHPDWNYELSVVQATLRTLGWAVTAEHTSVHAYALEPIGWDAVIATYPSLEPAIRRSLGRARAWSNLYLLERRTPRARSAMR
ncbi:MAG: bis-aminopropyl spermidine synthase family protein [Sandaracinaceae bacterium]